MNIEGKKNIDKFVAIILIMLITVSDFLFVGTRLISYALDVVNTNNENIEFMAYFLSDTNEKIDKIEKNIDEGAKLYIDISVKQEGYFNGKITLNNSNFNLKQQESSDYIEEITLNTVTLKQINAESTITLALDIESKAENTVNIQALIGETNVVLEGSYVNSKNVQKNKFIDITGTDTVEVDWKSSNESKAELEASVLTNYVYKIDDEEKRVVQILVNSKITSNNYPVKNTEVVLSVPENVKKIKAHTRSTDATNSNINFDKNNYTYDSENRTLTIKLQNEDQNNISWNKNAQDTIVVTYILNKEENLTNKDITVNSSLKTYDDKDWAASQNVHIEKEIDGIVSNSIETAEDAIYKGKIYTKEERDYVVKNTININYLNILDNITIKEKESVYVSDEKEEKANIVYKETKINKEEFLKIFGEDGYITVKNAEGIVVQNINKDTETDENGKIIINYQEGTQNVELYTSKPLNIGKLTIENTKAILDSNLPRETIDKLTGIKENLSTNNIEASKTITLKDTETVANINMNVKNIPIIDNKQSLELEVTLVSDDESKDLYKNPSVTITFPKEITITSAKYDVLYKNGLEIEEGTNSKNENGQYQIKIILKGEQEKYEWAGGTQIHIKAKIETDKLTPTKTSEIQMTYTNENKNETKETNAEFNFESQYGLMTYNQIASNLAALETKTTENGLNMAISATSGNKALTEGEDIFEGQTIKYKITLTNNTGKDYTNVNIKANQKNGYVWDYYEENVINYSYSEDVITEHYYEVKKLNEINLGKIDNLKNGDVYTYEYESLTYLLNDENIEGTQTQGTISVISEDNELNESFATISNNIKEAELKVELLELNSREAQWYSESSAPVELNIQNLTNSTQDNIKVQITLLKNLNLGEENESLYRVFSFNSKAEKVTLEGKETNESGQSIVTLTISSLEPNETISMGVTPYTSKIDVTEADTEMIAQAQTTSEKIYVSNGIKRPIYKVTHEIAVSQEVKLSDGNKLDSENKVLEDGEEITITGIITNKEDETFYPYIQYKIDRALEIEKATLITQDGETDVMSNIAANYLIIEDETIQANGNIKIIIVAKVNTIKTSENEVSNILNVMDKKTYMSTSSTDTFLINKTSPITNLEDTEKTIEDDYIDGNIIIGPDDNQITPSDNDEKDPNKPDDNSSGGKGTQETPSSNQNKYKVSGTAWIDKNEDGRKSTDEEKVKDMKVGVIKTQTGELIDTTQTDSNGEYAFNLPTGEYIIVFYYDDGIYNLTTYQADGVPSTENSDVISKTITVNNEDITVGATDSLKITSDISNIDIGLVNKSKFDLKLQKYISKVVVTNNAGTKTYDQKDKTTLTKVEIKSKNLKDSLVVIEYKIAITNVGEIEGYAMNIVDYLPSSLNFNSSLNSDWYQSGEYIYNTSLSNTKIKPGETKELILTVTKNMTETNTGLINNKAEIISSSNQLGIADQTEDKGSADVIISVSTGALISIVTLMISIVITIVTIAYLITKKKITIEMR